MSYYGYNGETEYERRVRAYEWEERLEEDIDRDTEVYDEDDE